MSFMNLPKLTPVPYGEPYPTFTRVSVETTSRCTRACAFCPQSLGREHGRMSDETIASLVRQLDGWRGVVECFGVNEPTADPRLPDVLRRLRGPGRCLYVSTNGDGWRRDPRRGVLAALDAGATVVDVNAYDDETVAVYRPVLERIVAEGEASWTDAPWRRQTGRRVHLRTTRDDLHDWNNLELARRMGVERGPTRGYCARPHRHLVIRWDGAIRLCCAAWPGLVVGHVDDLWGAWNGRTMFEYRAALQEGRREGACEGCTHRMAYPHVVRRVTCGTYPSSSSRAACSGARA